MQYIYFLKYNLCICIFFLGGLAMNSTTVKEQIKNLSYDTIFSKLYSEENLEEARARYLHAIEGFEKFYGKVGDIRLFSSPGRCEISGNHTDHQHGKVICASVDLDIIAVVEPTDNNCITLKSEGYDKVDNVDLSVLEVIPGERERSASLIRGIARAFKDLDKNIGGFRAYTISSVPSASGISSSAAFELLIVSILDSLYNNGDIDPIERARMAQFAENEFFGKPSGMLDQCGSAIGQIFSLNFFDISSPELEQLDISFEGLGYSIVLSKTGSNHADLTDEYAAVPNEMRKVASYFGKSYLAECDEKEFYNNIKKIRNNCGDRAVLRAIHFFDENKRVDRQIKSLKESRINDFMEDVKGSGLSSWTLLQNIYVASKPQEQAVSIALAYSQELLTILGGVNRVHGGGFSGTILAIVKKENREIYMKKMDELFGDGSSYVVRIRPVGACEVLN